MVLTVNSFLPELTCDPDIDARAHDRQFAGTHICEGYPQVRFYPQVADLSKPLFESTAYVDDRKGVLGRLLYMPGAIVGPTVASVIILI